MIMVGVRSDIGDSAESGSSGTDLCAVGIVVSDDFFDSLGCLW
jgi:hypothetical protein